MVLERRHIGVFLIHAVAVMTYSAIYNGLRKQGGNLAFMIIMNCQE